MNLVVGATGLLGSEVCRRLRARNKPVRALVRPGSARESELRQLGVEVVHGDLRDPASIEAACRGVKAVITTATAIVSKDSDNSLRAVDLDGQLMLVAAAKTNGVAHFVYVSCSPNLRANAPLVRYKRQVEAAIRNSGMQWSILQPSCFMEIWLSGALGWDFVAGKAMAFGAGTAPISFISVYDVAEYCVLALDDPRLVNRELPLGGPEAVSPQAVVKTFEAVSGRPYSTKHVPRLIPAMLSPVIATFNEKQASLMSLGAQTATGDRIDTRLQSELAVPLTSVRQYAERVVPARGL